MKDCNKIESLFERAIDKSLTPDEELFFKKHLSNCGTCRKEFNELQSTLDLFAKRERPEPNEDFMDNFWENLEPELRKKEKRFLLAELVNNLKEKFFYNKLVPQLTGAAVLILIGVFIGRFIVTDTPVIIPNENQIEQQTQNNIIQAKAERYIDRSKILLLGLMNFDPKDDIGAISLEHQKKISRELITEAADLKGELKNTSQRRLRELIADLEVVLLQIANLESEVDLEGIELVKSGVDRRGIFLKINIREMQEAGSLQFNSKENSKNEKNI